MTARPHPYDLTKHDGKTVDWLTHAALLKAEHILGYPLSIVQGSYNKGGVGASAGTHDGGGAVDCKPWDWQSKVRALRLSGFVAYHRPAIPGLWNEHIHAVLEGNAKLSPAAQRQVRDYHVGLDGLADHGPDPHQGMVFRGFHWPYNGPVGQARWIRDQLQGHDRKVYLDGLRNVVRGK